MSELKLNERAVKLLKNFSSYNPGIVFRPGNRLATVTPTKSVVTAQAELDDPIEGEFAISDLNRFFGALSLFKKPVIEIGERSLTIRGADEADGGRSLSYGFAAASVVPHPPVDKEIKFTPDVEFSVTGKQLSDAIKAASVLGQPEIALVWSDKGLRLQSSSSSKPTADGYYVDLGKPDYESQTRFTFVFKIENVNFVAADFWTVGLNFTKKIARFYAPDQKVEYFVASEAISKVG